VGAGQRGHPPRAGKRGAAFRGAGHTSLAAKTVKFRRGGGGQFATLGIIESQREKILGAGAGKNIGPRVGKGSIFGGHAETARAGKGIGDFQRPPGRFTRAKLLEKGGYGPCEPSKGGHDDFSGR